jgi:hypothetical protein
MSKNNICLAAGMIAVGFFPAVSQAGSLQFESKTLSDVAVSGATLGSFDLVANQTYTLYLTVTKPLLASLSVYDYLSSAGVASDTQILYDRPGKTLTSDKEAVTFSVSAAGQYNLLFNFGGALSAASHVSVKNLVLSGDFPVSSSPPVHGVPGPVAGAGLIPFLGMFGIALYRRRKAAKAT